MHWILQNNLFHETGYQTMVDTLERLDIPYSVHKVIPFIGQLDPLPELDTKNVMCIGSYSMRHAAKANGWTPGVFDLEPFDFRQQLDHWGEDMLNHDSRVVAFKDALEVFTDDSMFLRPIHDSKVFAGGIMSKIGFTEWHRKVCVLEEDYGDSLTKDTIIQVVPLKHIMIEYRFWVVKGKIVTASVYKSGGKVLYGGVPYGTGAEAFAIACIEKWQPLDAFVIDIAFTADCDYKIIEINTINSSGFYAGDVQKLVATLHQEFSE